MRKTVSIGIVIVFLLMPMSMAMAVIPTENIIENGTFDTDLDSWTVAESENFTITADGGHAKFNATDTDYIEDGHPHYFNNGTLYNMTMHYGNITGVGSGLSSEAHLELSNVTTTENLNPYFNESLNNWTYSETPYTSNFIRGNYSLFNHSSPESIAVESRKLQNETEDLVLSDGQYQGFGINNFIYNSTEDQVDARFIENNYSRYYWQTNDLNKSYRFGSSYEIQQNTSGLNQSGAKADVGYCNDAFYFPRKSAIWTTTQIFANHVRIYCTTYSKTSGSASSGYASITFNNFTHGVRVETYYYNNTISFFVHNKTSNYLLGGGYTSILLLADFHVNSYALSCLNTTAPLSHKKLDCYVSNISIWQDVTNRQTIAWGQVNQTFDLSAEANVSVELYRRHKHDAQLGFIRSAGEVTYGSNPYAVEHEELIGEDENTFYTEYGRVTNHTLYITDGVDWEALPDEDYDFDSITGEVYYGDGLGDDQFYMWYNCSRYEGVYNQSSTATTGWIKESTTFETNETDFDMKLWTYHTLTEGNTSFVAKGTYWDDCWVNSTSWAWNGTYTSPVFDRGYFADWMHIQVSLMKPFTNDGFNFTVYMRCGNKPTVEPVNWTDWQKVTDFIRASEIPEYPIDYEGWWGAIPCPNNQYLQYTLGFWGTNRAKTPQYVGSRLSSAPIMISKDWGILNQEVTKPYTDDVIFKYKYKVDHLNNSKNGSFHVWIDDYVVEEYNFTYFETGWRVREWTLPTTYNASGTYDVRARAYFEFNSTNGTGTILWDDVEFLIEKQSPTITEFNIINGTAIQFNGTFTDYSRGSDYQFLGLDGIDVINITVGVHELEVDDITYLGDGEFFFEYLWASTPFEITNTTILNATVRVTDIAGLYDEAVDSLVMPSVTQFIIALMTLGFLVMIIMLIFQRHLFTAWDTDKTKSNERIMPDSITGNNKGR